MFIPSFQMPSIDELQYIVHHVFLPPKLPQNSDDLQPVVYEELFMSLLSNALQRFRVHVDPNVKYAIDVCYNAVLRIRDVKDIHGFNNGGKLRYAFSDVGKMGRLANASSYDPNLRLTTLQESTFQYM
jgi:hypothetical protein